MTDATVPEGHKSLHGALYGEGGAEVHSSRKAGYQLIPVRTAMRLIFGHRPPAHRGHCMVEPPISMPFPMLHCGVALVDCHVIIPSRAGSPP